MSRMKMNCSESVPGCVFEHCGQIPESVYDTDEFNSPLEQAVYANDLKLFRQLVQEGHTVSVKLKVGKMTCIEYAAMKGYAEILQALLELSINANMLKKYFSLDDVVERAYLISRNKSVFFEEEALAEANRYEAALYTAIEYDRPECVEVIMRHVSKRELAKDTFYTNGSEPERLTACQLAKLRGHMECYSLLSRRAEQAAL